MLGYIFIGLGLACLLFSPSSDIYIILAVLFFGWGVCALRNARKPYDSFDSVYIPPHYPKGASTQYGGYVDFNDGYWEKNYDGSLHNTLTGDTVEPDIYGNYYFCDDANQDNESASYGGYTMEF